MAISVALGLLVFSLRSWGWGWGWAGLGLGLTDRQAVRLEYDSGAYSSKTGAELMPQNGLGLGLGLGLGWGLQTVQQFGWSFILLHIAAKPALSSCHRMGWGWGWAGAGLGLTDRRQAVRLEFPAPCGCGLWLWAAACGAAAK